MPEFIVELLLTQYGEKIAENILKGYLVERPVLRLGEDGKITFEF